MEGGSRKIGIVALFLNIFEHFAVMWNHLALQKCGENKPRAFPRFREKRKHSRDRIGATFHD
jgi:hypothetical protein